MDRKSFLKKSCISAACGCGFTVLMGAEKETQAGVSFESNQNKLLAGWTKALLQKLVENNDVEKNRKWMQELSQLHFDQLEMTDLLRKFKGNLPEFLKFLSSEWGWKIDYTPERKQIIADENKNNCVCPLVAEMKDVPPVICYCSEGFATRMFSLVTGQQARAKVISSVLNGDSTCCYQIDLA